VEDGRILFANQAFAVPGISWTGWCGRTVAELVPDVPTAVQTAPLL